MAYFRKGEKQDILVVGNFLAEERQVPLADKRQKKELLSNASVEWTADKLVLKPFQVVVLSLE